MVPVRTVRGDDRSTVQAVSSFSLRCGRPSMRTKLAVIICILGLGTWGWTPAASAHHAFAAEFDANKPVNFKGKIKKMEWVNPHSWLHIEVEQPDGTVVNWAIEAGTPNVLFRRGFTKENVHARRQGGGDGSPA